MELLALAQVQNMMYKNHILQNYKFKNQNIKKIQNSKVNGIQSKRVNSTYLFLNDRILSFILHFNQNLILFTMTDQENHLNTPFLRKLNYILTNKLYANIIRWDQTGTMIDVFDQNAVQKQILPNFFRHSKFKSFVRQLNLYGFRKMKKKFCHRFKHPDLRNENSFFNIKLQRKYKNSGQKSSSLLKSRTEQSRIQEQIKLQRNVIQKRSSLKNENLNQVSGADKKENVAFDLISYPLGFEPFYQNSLYLNAFNFCQQYNGIQNSNFPTFYLPNANNGLFYN